MKRTKIITNSVFGCFGGCVVEIIGFLVLIWILGHFSVVVKFVGTNLQNIFY